MDYFEVEKDLRIAIDNGREVELISSSVDQDMEKQLRLVLDRILDRYTRNKLFDTIFACIIELATNGTKANMKHLFLSELNDDAADSKKHKENLKAFKKALSDKSWVQKYSIQAREQGFFVKIAFTHDHDGITIRISNNLPLSNEDEERIRKKFNLAMKYDDLISFYDAHHDDSEGEGLGFALNVILMKGENIDPALFRIGNVENQTVARIEIPFSNDFKSIRNKLSE